MNGIKLAVSEINASGGFVVGNVSYTITLDPEDDASTPTTGVEVVQKMIGNGEHFMLGMLSSDVVSAYLPIIGGRTDFLAIASGVSLPSVTSYPNLFRLAAGSIQQTASAEVNFMKSKGWHNVAIFTDRTHAGFMQEDKPEVDALRSAGISVADEEYYSIGTAQYGAQLSVVLAKHPDAIDIRGYPKDALTIIHQARALGYTGPFVTASDPTASQVTAANVEADMHDVFTIAAPFVTQVATAQPGAFPNYAEAAAQRLAQSYTSMFGSPMGLLSGPGYATTYILVQAMKDAKTTSNIAAIENALNKMTISEVEAHLPQQVIPGPGNTLFQKHDAVLPWLVSEFKPLTSSGQFVIDGPVSGSYPGLSS